MTSHCLLAILLLGSCAMAVPAGNDADDDPSSSTPPVTGGDSADPAPDSAADPPESDRPLDGAEGAIVTADCTFRDYEYAIDILLSCGDERFGEELRLHTFKRHAHDHRKVFNDQRLTHRDGQLWFDGYSTPRCVVIDTRGRLQLSTDAERCAPLVFQPQGDGHRLAEASGGRCAGLASGSCDDHASTGGRECGGISHRYLPLAMGPCSSALTFRFEADAGACDGEYPRDACF